MKKTITIKDCVAQDIMNSIFTLYQCVALSLGLDTENEKDLEAAHHEGVEWAKKEFCRICDNFEKDLVTIKWLVAKEEEEDEDY